MLVFILLFAGFGAGQPTALREKRVSFGGAVVPPLQCPKDTYPVYNSIKLTKTNQTAPLNISDFSQNYIIDQIEFHIFGVPLDNEASFTLIIGDKPVTNQVMRKNENSSTFCHQQLSTTVTNDDYQTLNWDYRGSNSLTVSITNGTLFLSNITLDITIIQVLPAVKDITPLVLSVGKTSSKLVINLFDPVINGVSYMCKFSNSSTYEYNQTMTAHTTSTDQQTVMCSLFPQLVEQEGDLWLKFLPNLTINVEYLLVSWQRAVVAAPKITVITPSRGIEGDSVIISGVGFYKNAEYQFSFGADTNLGLVAAHFINDTALWVTAPKNSFSSPSQTIYCTNLSSIDSSHSLVLWDSQFSPTSCIFVYNMHLIPLNPALTPTPTPIIPIPVSPPASAPTSNLVPLVPSNSTNDNPLVDFGEWIKNNIALVVLLGLGLLVVIVGIVFCVQRRRAKLATPTSSEVLISEIKMGEKIGRGSFADVYRARWRHTDIAVKKMVDVHLQEVVDDFLNEANLMLGIRHPNIVTFMGTCQTSDSLCIITEYLDHGTLHQVIHSPDNNIDNEDIRRFAEDCCKGMAYLHGSYIIHRDLKSKNLLIDRHWNLKVSDFGLSKLVIDNTAHTFTSCGTPAWTAPEVLRNDPYSFEADVYSFGVILYEMVALREPYSDIPSLNVVVKVAVQGLRPTLPDSLLDTVPNFFQKIMKRCWHEDPQQRPSFGLLSEKLEKQAYPITPDHLHNKKYSRSIQAKKKLRAVADLAQSKSSSSSSNFRSPSSSQKLPRIRTKQASSSDDADTTTDTQQLLKKDDS